jgi:hypothetical protein
MTIDLAWGRSIPEEMLNKIAATWGARAIYTSQVIDLLPDHQSWYVPGLLNTEPEADIRRKRLAKWINDTALPFLRKEATRLYGDESRIVTLDDGLFHIEASPQSSHGYLYIRAWELRVQE